MIKWNFKLKMQYHLNWHSTNRMCMGKSNEYAQDLYEKNYKSLLK